MKTAALIIATFAAIITGAETLDALKARCIADGIVAAIGPPTHTAAAIAVDTATGKSQVTEIDLYCIVTTNDDGDQRATTLRVLVYDIGTANESAVIADTTRNFSAPTPTATPFESAKIAVDAALGVGAWKFVGLESSDAGTIATIRRNSDNAKLAVTLAADGTPLTVEAE